MLLTYSNEKRENPLPHEIRIHTREISPMCPERSPLLLPPLSTPLPNCVPPRDREAARAAPLLGNQLHFVDVGLNPGAIFPAEQDRTVGEVAVPKVGVATICRRVFVL